MSENITTTPRAEQEGFMGHLRESMGLRMAAMGIVLGSIAVTAAETTPDRNLVSTTTVQQSNTQLEAFTSGGAVTARIWKHLILHGTEAEVDYSNPTGKAKHFTTLDAGRVHHFKTPYYDEHGSFFVSIPMGKHKLKVFKGRTTEGKLLDSRWLDRVHRT